MYNNVNRFKLKGMANMSRKPEKRQKLKGCSFLTEDLKIFKTVGGVPLLRTKKRASMLNAKVFFRDIIMVRVLRPRVCERQPWKRASSTLVTSPFRLLNTVATKHMRATSLIPSSYSMG